MDTVTHFEYPERVVTYTNNVIIINDLGGPSRQTYRTPGIDFFRKLRNDLFLKMHNKDGCYYYDFSFLNEKMQVKNSFTVNLQHDKIVNIFPVMVFDHYLLLITVTPEHSNIFLLDIDKKVLMIDPIRRQLPGQTLAVFKFGDEIIVFQRPAWDDLKCYVIKIEGEEMNIHYEAYQDTMKQLGVVSNIIAFEDGEGFIVGGLRNKSVTLVHSSGLLLYQSDHFGYLFGPSVVKYDKYTNSVLIKTIEGGENRIIGRIYRHDGKFVTEKIKRKFRATCIVLTTQNNILFGDTDDYIVCDRKTIEITYRLLRIGKSDVFYYDFYDKWFKNELERLLGIDVLKKMSRDILIVILSYVS